MHSTTQWLAQTPDCRIRSHSHCLAVVRRFNLENQSTCFHLVTRLLAVVDLLEGDGPRGEEVAQFGQIDAVPEPLLQLCGGRQLLVQTGLHPPVRGADAHHMSHITVHTKKKHAFIFIYLRKGIITVVTVILFHQGCPDAGFNTKFT